MERKIAGFGERIVIQKARVKTDRYANHVNTWEDHYACHAYASTWEHDEEGGASVEEDRTITFEVRWCSEVAGISSDRFRIIFRGEVYDILSVDLMNYDHSVVRMKAKRRVREVRDG